MDTTINTEINNSFDEFNKTFIPFTEAEINTIPFQGSWTAGQVAEHIVKSISALPYVFYNNTVPTTRPYEEYVAPITEMFLDHSRKFQAADHIFPSNGPHNKTGLLNTLAQLQQTMLDAATTQDLSITCNSIGFPLYGCLTRREWLAVYLSHMQRHTTQVKNIYEQLHR